MCAADVITNYSLFGAAAQMRYTEPVATLHADVLVSVPDPHRLDLVSDVYAFCVAKAFPTEGESIRVGAWPTQFIPALTPLTWDAMELADTVDFEGVPFRVVRADHLAVITLSVGRPKDFARILALLESESVSREEIELLAARHGYGEEWRRFARRFFDE